MYVTLSNKVFMRLFLILEDIPKEYTLSSCSLNHQLLPSLSVIVLGGWERRLCFAILVKDIGAID
jgi:hypothetical protein